MPILVNSTGSPLLGTRKFSNFRGVLAQSAKNPPRTLLELFQLTTAIGAAWCADFYAMRATEGSSTSETKTPVSSAEPQSTLSETTDKSLNGTKSEGVVE